MLTVRNNFHILKQRTTYGVQVYANVWITVINIVQLRIDGKGFANSCVVQEQIWPYKRVDIPLGKRTKVQERLDLLSKLVKDLIFTLEI